ncbi:perilipin-2-like [Archocentrus centrarchus]|uniref:perilipin-2-like n=1 Tax=Archocentrus centrarchus TaxID=63155 RepID=UPI0011E9F520|nr:perilipin-2-like [Archocentrus centrarchus]
MFLFHRSGRNMPTNNNQKVPCAAGRLAKLPIVSSACASLSVLYTDTKSRHPCLKSACEVLESSVTALGIAACYRASPVIVKLKPQIDYIACKSLDWLEASFPVILSPTDQLVTTAKNKMHEIEAGMSTAANGTMDCVRHAVTWVTSTMNDGTNHSVVETVINAATVGLDTALSLSEALVDKVLPPTQEEEAHLMEGFEAVTFRARYPERLCSLSAKVCRRIYHDVESKIQAVQVMGSLSRPSALVQNLQTSWPALVWRVQRLPQYLQNQVFSGFFFFIQMYNLNSQPTHKKRSKVRSGQGPPIPLKGVRATSGFQKGRAAKTSGFGNGSKTK